MSSTASDPHAFIAWGLAAAFLAAGCAGPASRPVNPARTNAYLADKPAAVQPAFRRVIEGPANDRCLRLLEAALTSMDQGHYDLATRTFDEALTDIEAIYGTNANARRARSMWHNEGAKDYKGEPYERAMAYYYRGLLYLRDGEFDSARACFKAAVIQDAFAEEEQNRCDFALMLFLQGWACRGLGQEDLATEAFNEVRRLRPDFNPPPPQHNGLVIAETGTSPRKVADGVGHYQLKFRRGRGFLEKRAVAEMQATTLPLYPIEDIYLQAATRGGRPVDCIVQGKAKFAHRTAAAGTVLTDIGTAAMIASPALDSSVGTIGAALGLAGVVSQAVSISAKTRADTRYWRNLPDAVHVATFRMPPTSAPETMSVRYLDEGGRPVLGDQTAKFIRTGRTNGLIWVRSQSATLP